VRRQHSTGFVRRRCYDEFVNHPSLLARRVDQLTLARLLLESMTLF